MCIVLHERERVFYMKKSVCVSSHKLIEMIRMFQDCEKQ